MNILMIFTVSLDFNGINVSTIELLQKIQDKHNFYILSCRSSNPKMVKRFEEVGCKVLKNENRDKHPFRYYSDLRKIIRKYDIDIVHAMGNSSTLAIEMMAAKKEKIKLRIAHSRNTLCKHKVLNKILYYSFNKNCNSRIACGYDAGKWLFKNNDFVILKNGKDYNKYAFSRENRNEIRLKLGINEKEICIGHVGVFNNQKNHKFIIDLIESIKDNSTYKFFLFGEGPLKNEIEKISKEKKVFERILFLGNVDDINRYYSAMDLMILPSLYEGLPNVVIEWQINGLPCIISNNITKECVINDNVVFLDIDNPLDWVNVIFSKKLNRILDDDLIRHRLVEKGFDLDENSRKLLEIYNSIN